MKEPREPSGEVRPVSSSSSLPLPYLLFDDSRPPWYVTEVSPYLFLFHGVF